VALRPDGEDFIVVLEPEDIADANALRKVCAFLGCKIVSDTSARHARIPAPVIVLLNGTSFLTEDKIVADWYGLVSAIGTARVV
jgi:hypothetical protein